MFPPTLRVWLLRLAPLLLLLIVLGLLFFLVQKGHSALSLNLLFGDTPPLMAVLGQAAVWNGLWPACAGTLYLVLLTLLLALFPGLCCGIYLAEYANRRSALGIGLAMDILAGTPSIVMGLFGFTLIVFLRRTFCPSANTSLLLSAACLALLVLPNIVSNTREALAAIPRELRITALALGLGKNAMIRHILLPQAVHGIAAGVVLALARAAEDTAVIMLTGAVANSGLPAGLLDRFEALPFSIYYTAAEYQNADELASGFGAALILLALSALLVFLAHLLERRFLQRSRGYHATGHLC
ncbi:MAG: ABC transporter permease subunit [Desulfovibrio sp.]|nr:ABC transporter permease subunit [Desulfovibrio sp.]